MDFKAQDGLRNASKTTVWSPLHFEKTIREGTNTAGHKINEVLQAISSMAPGSAPSILKQVFAWVVAEDEILRVVDRVFEHSLISEPNKRSLPAIIDILRPAATTNVPISELVSKLALQGSTPSTYIGDVEPTKRESDPAEKENAQVAKVEGVPDARKASPQSWEDRGFKVPPIGLRIATSPLTAYRICLSHGKSSAHFRLHCSALFTELCQTQRRCCFCSAHA